jgi:uncharacterized FAD-dependent dehydrogenase
MNKHYTVIVVGAGPAGLFASLELCRNPNLDVLILEKGADIDQRVSLVSGLGGAGAYSDGKLTLSLDTGGRLKEYVSSIEAKALIQHVEKTYLKFSQPVKIFNPTNVETRDMAQHAASLGLHLIPVPVRHLGTEQCRSVLRSIRDHLTSKIELRLGVKASSFIVSNGQIKGLETSDGEKLYCDYLIAAPGREGAEWLASQTKQLGIRVDNNPIDVGIRVELPAWVLKRFTDLFYEVKLEYQAPTFKDRIRTFCMCPEGEVIEETTGGPDPVTTVNGQSYSHRKTNNTNFALLMTTDFTEPFHEPIAYGKYLARLANMLGNGVLIQRLGDLMSGHRSTPERIGQGVVHPTLNNATPGDISFVLPYRCLIGIMEMILAMDKLVPGIASADTLIYGVEVKFYSYRPKLDSSLETEIKNLFCVGDGAGVSRGLVQSSASGVVAAREILVRA